MALNVFAFCAIFFLLIALALTGGLIYVQIAKNKPAVNTLVRTTFTGNPAVLTSALWGVSNPSSVTSYATEAAYGPGYDHDSINALHCDVYEGYGTVSTWVSDGGINFRNRQRYGFLQTASTLYFDDVPCNQNSDCSVTRIKCGPTVEGWNTGVDFLGVRNPAADQCPSGVSNTVYCNVCGGPPNGLASYCSSSTVSNFAQGHCVNTSANNPLNCVRLNSISTAKYCLSFKPVSGTNTVPFDRVNSCSSIDDIGSRGVSGICSASAVDNWYCNNSDPLGNAFCALGQRCVLNTNSSSGWCPQNGGCTNLETATRVCSGDIPPNISINTQWIAEGKVISTNGTTSVVQWERVQNTYQGVGPSPNLFSTDSTRRALAADDNSWAYSDCRFIDNGETGRHASVSKALLGTSVTNPFWGPVIDPVRNSATENLLYVGTSTGTIASSPINQTNPYYRSAWTLRSLNVPNSQLERIWFYSIFPLEGIPAHPLPKLKAAVQVNFGLSDLDDTIDIHG